MTLLLLNTTNTNDSLQTLINQGRKRRVLSNTFTFSMIKTELVFFYYKEKSPRILKKGPDAGC